MQAAIDGACYRLLHARVESRQIAISQRAPTSEIGTGSPDVDGVIDGAKRWSN
jgi:hypothetical protein